MGFVTMELLLVLAYILLKQNSLGAEANIRGTPGIDYPNYFIIPQTSFRCSDQKHNPGLYADVETRCQVFHYCYEHRQESFLCPLGTIFNQPLLSCDYWYSSNCSQANLYYDINDKKRDSYGYDMGEPSPFRQTKSNQLFDKMASLHKADVIARVGTQDHEGVSGLESESESISVSTVAEDSIVDSNNLEHGGNSSSGEMSATFTQYADLQNAEDLVLSDDGTLQPGEQYTYVSESTQSEENSDIVHNEQVENPSHFIYADTLESSDLEVDGSPQTEEEISFIPYEQQDNENHLYYSSSSDDMPENMVNYYDEPDSDFLRRSVNGGMQKRRRRRPIYVIPEPSLEKTEMPELTSPMPEVEQVSIIGVDSFDNRYLVQDPSSSKTAMDNINIAPDTRGLIDTISYINGFEGPQEKNQRLYYDVTQSESEKYSTSDVDNERPNLIAYDDLNLESKENVENSDEEISPEEVEFSSLESAFEQGTIANLRDGVFYSDEFEESSDAEQEENEYFQNIYTEENGFNQPPDHTDVNSEAIVDKGIDESDLPSYVYEMQESYLNGNSEGIQEISNDMSNSMFAGMESSSTDELITSQESDEIIDFSTLNESDGSAAEHIPYEATHFEPGTSNNYIQYSDGNEMYQDVVYEDLAESEYPIPQDGNEEPDVVENQEIGSGNLEDIQNMDKNGELYQEEIYVDSELEKSTVENGQDFVDDGQSVNEYEASQFEVYGSEDSMESTEGDKMYQARENAAEQLESTQSTEEENVEYVVPDSISNSASDDQEVEYISVEEYEKLYKQYYSENGESGHNSEQIRYYYENANGEEIDIPLNEYLNENNLPEGYVLKDSDDSQYEDASNLNTETSETSVDSEADNIGHQVEEEVMMDHDLIDQSENISIDDIQNNFSDSELQTDSTINTESKTNPTVEEISFADGTQQLFKEHEDQKLSVDKKISKHQSQEPLNKIEEDTTLNSISGGSVMNENVFDPQLQDFNEKQIDIKKSDKGKPIDVQQSSTLSKTVYEANVQDKKQQIGRKTTMQRGKSARSLTSSPQKNGFFNAPGVDSLFVPPAFGDGFASPYSEFDSFEFQNAKAANLENPFSSPRSSKLASIVKNLLAAKKSKLNKYFGSK